MTEHKKDKKKTDLLWILSDVESDGQDLAAKGHEIVHQGQYLFDLAHYTKKFIETIPDDSFIQPNKWDEQLYSWKKVHEEANITKKVFSNMKSLGIATDGSNVSSTGLISTETIASLPTHYQDKARLAYERFEQLLEHPNRILELETEIHRLRLTTTGGGGHSTLSLLRQADQALKAPSDKEVAPSAVLIPLRESINRAFADLLKRRPQQEKTKNDKEKVMSICKQCCRDGVEVEQIEAYANEAYDLTNLLSKAKQEMLTRDRVRELMNRGLVFLLAFFRILDEKKMRS